MELSERAQALAEAENVKRGFTPSAASAWRISDALIGATEREQAYQRRIVELTDAVERITRSSVENATRHAADLAAERRAGAAAVERIRAALLEGASDAEQRGAVIESTRMVDGTWAFRLNDETKRLARAYLALSASHAEARALLSDISERARTLLGKAPT